MSLLIKINNSEELEEFRKCLHRINELGIDKICDIIDYSIKSEETDDFYLLSYSMLFKKEKSK